MAPKQSAALAEATAAVIEVEALYNGAQRTVDITEARLQTAQARAQLYRVRYRSALAARDAMLPQGETFIHAPIRRRLRVTRVVIARRTKASAWVRPVGTSTDHQLTRYARDKSGGYVDGSTKAPRPQRRRLVFIPDGE